MKAIINRKSRFRLLLRPLMMLFMSLGFSVHAQNTIGIDTSSSSIPSAATAGDSITFSLTLVNNSTTLFYTDTLSLDIAVDTSSGFSSPVEFASFTQLSIAPASSFVPIPLKIHISADTASPPSSLRVRIGGNVIVVWPRVKAPFATGDSLFAFVNVDTITSIREQTIDPFQIICAPNPVQTLLFVQSTPSVKIKTIVVRDAQGRIMEQIPYTGDPINMAQWSSGIYLFEFQFENGERRLRKILH
jgi:hypothetical protein